MNRLKYLLGPARPPFLLLTPACVALGVGTAVWTTGHVAPIDVVIVLIGALAAHVSVNALNEYFDFKSGLDFRTQRTPFSGGSGTLPQKPEYAPHALAIGVGSFIITALVGVYFLAKRGLALLPLGVLGLAIVGAYTVWITRRPLLCLVAPGLGFGPLMVMGTNFALTGQYTWTAFVASLVPFFLVSNLLLLNQFPDVEPDRQVGRRHLPIVLGRRAASIVYGAFLLLAYVALVAGVFAAYLPRASLFGLITVVAAVPAAIGAYKHADNVQGLLPFMTANVLINLLTPVLVAVGLFIS
ncbi:MAG: prenyltransferase [Verrucomicrobiae bacterium]|nr:prenyltransferase [Verrucomicrobiae bacterium]MCX7721673.1 prenyltransferase [Verrucomicrobiae bacterium]MDW7979382.1 prenyltransferase [Verrucomicrobiales bacterium]